MAQAVVGRSGHGNSTCWPTMATKRFRCKFEKKRQAPSPSSGRRPNAHRQRITIGLWEKFDAHAPEINYYVNPTGTGEEYARGPNSFDTNVRIRICINTKIIPRMNFLFVKVTRCNNKVFETRTRTHYESNLKGHLHIMYLKSGNNTRRYVYKMACRLTSFVYRKNPIAERSKIPS